MYERTNVVISLPAMSEAVRRLKARVKQEAKDIREMRREATQLEGRARHELQMRTRWKGDYYARSTLLAYAMLRGRAYETVERFARKPPYPTQIAKTIREAFDLPPDVTLPIASTTTVNRWSGWDGSYDWRRRWKRAA